MTEFLIQAKPLEEAIKTLQPFMSAEETRYYLCGVFFEWDGAADKINMVATDGHKLCVLQKDFDPEQGANPVSVIVPADALKTILQILKSVGNAEMPVTLKFNESGKALEVITPDQKAEFRCIDATFPDYRSVIPKDKANFQIGLMKPQALEAVKAVKAHKSKEAMVWHLTDENSPIKLVGQDKLVVIMPCRTSITEMDLRQDTKKPEAA